MSETAEIEALQSPQGMEMPVPLPLRLRMAVREQGREKLLEQTAWLLQYAIDQVKAKKPTEQLKRGWCQTGLYAIQVANSVLKDAELEELKRRIDLLEAVRSKDR